MEKTSQEQSLIVLLKQALLFYADENNYNEDKRGIPVQLDGGSQAKFALTKINEYDKFEDNIYAELLNTNPINGNEQYDLLEILKQMNDGKPINP